MKPLEVIILFGAACVSPVTPVENGTVVEKVPCAKVIYLDANPYKVAQEQNAITVAPQQPKAKARKASRLCGAKRPVWYVKKGKKRYRCR